MVNRIELNDGEKERKKKEKKKKKEEKKRRRRRGEEEELRGRGNKQRWLESKVSRINRCKQTT